MFRLVAVPHPFSSDRTIRELEPGPTIRELVEEVQPVTELRHAHVLIGDELIPESDWDSRRPVDDDLVIIRIIPAGSPEGGAKAAGWLGVLAIIAGVILWATGVGAVVGQLLITTGLALAASGFGIYTVLNTLAPMGSQEQEKSPPNIRGARNQANPWGSVPVILGKHLVMPPYGASPYTEIVGEDQYLRLLFILGYSPLTVTDLKIGDTAIGEYDDVEYEILQDSTPSTLFPDQIIENTLNILLEQSAGGQIQTTELDTDEVSVDITFPQGLVQFEDDGSKTSLTVVVTCDYSPTGENDWTLFHTFDISAAQQKTLRYGQRFALPSRGQYDIRLTRTTADRTGDKQFDKVYWTALRSITDEDPVAESIRDKIVRVAMRIRATDQLNGIVNQFNAVCTSQVPVYSGSGSGAAQWTTVEASQNPAAMLLYMLRGEPNPKPVPDDRIDWPAFEAWYQWCVSSGHTCNAVHGRGEALRTILNRIASTGRASVSVRDGKYSVIYDIERITVIQLFTPRNSWGFEGQKAFIDPPHALKLRFISEPAGWQQDEIIVYDDGYSADGAGETEVATEFKTVEIWGITDPDQLWQDGRYQLAAIKLRPEIYSFYADVESIVCQRGDLIRVQHDVPLLGISSGRIKSLTVDGEDNVLAMAGDETFLMVGGQSYAVRIRKADGTYLEKAVDTEAGEQTEVTFTTPIPAAEAPAVGDLYSFGLQDLETVEMVVVGIEMGEDLEAKIYCVDHSPDIYDADTGEIPEYDPQVTLPVDYQAVPPTPVIVEVRSNETVMLASGHDFVTQLFVSLAPGGAGTVYTERYEVQLRQNGTQDLWVSFSVPATNPSLVIGDVVAGATYDIRARALSPEGVPSEWATTIHNVATPPAPASPTYVEMQEGYSTGGGTKTPTVPTIAECRAIGLNAITLYWDRQPNLTNFDRYDVQVSANQSDWYALRNDGVDWKGTINEFTSVDIEYITHENIPPGGTEDNPTALTLYYKVRRVTKEPVPSNYSTAASATTNLIESKYIKQDAITTAKIINEAIAAAKLAAGAVIAEKIGAGAVTTDKLYALAVTAAKIAAGAVETAKLAALAVTAEKISANAVETAKLNANAVTAVKIAANAVETDKIKAGAVTADKIAAVALEAQFANISYQLTIGFSGTGTPSSPNTNDERIFLDGNQINFQLYNGASWVNRLSFYPSYVNNPTSGLYLGGNGVANILGLGIGDNFTYFARAFRFNRVGVSSNTTLGDTAVLVEGTSSGAAFTLTLPAPTAGRFMIIRKYGGAEDGTRDITISPSSGNILIDGQGYGSLKLRFIGQEVWLIGNGVNWNKVNSPRWHKVPNPGTGWLASKTTGWTVDSFSGGLEVDFFTVVPAGTLAVKICLMQITTLSSVYYRKSGDANISNTPSASGEYSHRMLYADYLNECTIWLSSNYKAQFAVMHDGVDLYIPYPSGYLL